MLSHCGSLWKWSCCHWCTHRAVSPRNHGHLWTCCHWCPRHALSQRIHGQFLIFHFWSQFQLVTCSQFQLVVRLYALIVTFSCSHFVHTFAPRKHVIWGGGIYMNGGARWRQRCWSWDKRNLISLDFQGEQRRFPWSAWAQTVDIHGVARTFFSAQRATSHTPRLAQGPEWLDMFFVLS